MPPGLDLIDWSQHFHAYGPATDIPKLLRSLADPSEDVREEAMFELCNSINHQGSIYEATAHVVPFLFEMAQDTSVPNRAAVLGIVGGISEAWTEALRANTAAPSTSPLYSRPTAERFASERPYRQAAHQAVENGFTVLCGFLRDPEVPVRLAALFVIATLMDHREEAALKLHEIIDQEAEDWCRAAAILALLELVRTRPLDHVSQMAARRFRKIHADDVDFPDARLCAGLALLHLGDAEPLPQTLALVRSRLPHDMKYFLRFPSSRHSRNLFGLMLDSLRGWPESRLAWICEGLEHPDPEVNSTALFEAGCLCREVCWGPSRLVPSIVKLVETGDEKTRGMAVWTLAELGSAGFRELSLLSRHPVEEVRTEAADRLKHRRSREEQRLTTWNELPPPVLASVEALVQTIGQHRDSRNWNDVEKVCKALVQLGTHGPNAASTVELIGELIDSISGGTSEICLNPLAASDLRLNAIRAHWKIKHDAQAIVPHLIASLVPDRYCFLVIEQLREIGPSASEALPALRQIVDSEHRFPSVGDLGGCCPDDEAFRTAAANAIAAIEQQP